MGDAVTLTPRAGVVFTSARTDDYTTRGYTVKVKSRTQRSLVVPLTFELAYAKTFSGGARLKVSLDGGFRHDIINQAPKSSSFIDGTIGGVGTDIFELPVQGNTPVNDVWNVGTGIRYENERVEAYLRYGYDTASRYHSHQVTGGVGVKF